MKTTIKVMLILSSFVVSASFAENWFGQQNNPNYYQQQMLEQQQRQNDLLEQQAFEMRQERIREENQRAQDAVRGNYQYNFNQRALFR